MTESRSPSAVDTAIHQEVDFAASPARVYEALLDEQQFSALTGAPSQIQRGAGGAFKLFAGRVAGRIVELLPNRRIVQAWRIEAWPSGVYAIVHGGRPLRPYTCAKAASRRRRAQSAASSTAM